MAENKGSRPYGWLPEMALTYIGQLMASSYAERVNSAAKLILNKKNLKLKVTKMKLSTSSLCCA